MNIITTVIVAGAVVFSSGAHALRCGNILVDIGTPVTEVRANCPITTEYQVNNAIADITTLTYNENGMIHTMKFIDGKLNSINSSRF